MPKVIIPVSPETKRLSVRKAFRILSEAVRKRAKTSRDYSPVDEKAAKADEKAQARYLNQVDGVTRAYLVEGEKKRAKLLARLTERKSRIDSKRSRLEFQSKALEEVIRKIGQP